jgi:uncharacterized protein
LILNEQLLSLLLILIVSIVLIITGLKKQPGIGIVFSLVAIILAYLLRKESLLALGFNLPANWLSTILLGLALGLAIQLLSVALIEPWSERLTHTMHDHSVVENVKGNWKAFIQWMLAVWIIVAILEEGIYRGFLMTETAKVLGTGTWALLVNILFSSVVFGLSHGYQGRSGMLSTGIVGILLGSIFVLSSFNLWIVIFTHGFIDTIGIGLIAIGGDRWIRDQLRK